METQCFEISSRGFCIMLIFIFDDTVTSNIDYGMTVGIGDRG